MHHVATFCIVLNFYVLFRHLKLLTFFFEQFFMNVGKSGESGVNTRVDCSAAFLASCLLLDDFEFRALVGMFYVHGAHRRF